MADIGYNERVARIGLNEQKWFADRRKRQEEADNRKNKKRSGQLVINDPGSVHVKLAKTFGGKSANRMLKRERIARRDHPDAVTVIDTTNPDAPVELVRGIDFAVVRVHDEVQLVLHDRVKNFSATWGYGY